MVLFELVFGLGDIPLNKLSVESNIIEIKSVERKVMVFFVYVPSMFCTVVDYPWISDLIASFAKVWIIHLFVWIIRILTGVIPSLCVGGICTPPISFGGFAVANHGQN